MSAPPPSLDADVIESALAHPQKSAGSSSTLHHIAFAVSDVGMAMRQWSAMFGTGPFCRIDDPDPAAPRPAFVWWGSVFVEFVQMRIEGDPPPALVSRFDHVCYMTDAPGEEGERLAGLGLGQRGEFRHGLVWAQQYDGAQSLGCAVEIHRAGPELAESFSGVRAAALAWDGSELERAVPPPGHQASERGGS